MMGYLSPLKAEEGYLYFLDAREYGPDTFSDEGIVSGSLCRVPLTGGEIEVLSGPGIRVIGWEEGRIFYTKESFWYDIGEESQQMPVEEGLYRCDANGENEVKLASLETGSQNAHYVFRHMDDGVIYGVYYDYSLETGETSAVLKRVTAWGEALADIAIPDATLCAADDGKLVFAQYYADETETGAYAQADKILLLDTGDGSIRTLNDERSDILFFTEGEPSMYLDEDALYWVGYNTRLAAMEFYCMNLEDGTVLLLANGYSWANEEEAVG